MGAGARRISRHAPPPGREVEGKARAATEAPRFALELLVERRKEEAKAGRKSESTADFYEAKAGHWTRVLESNSAGTYVPFPLAKLRANHVNAFISQRREEGAGENTISRSSSLRAALKLAKRAGLWKGDVDAVVPSGFSPEHKPKQRALSYAELQKLLGELTPDRAARVAFIVATSANWNESELAERADVAANYVSLLIRGTKRASRFRTVPIVSHDQRSLLEHAVKHAEGKDGMLFTKWGNVRRDLHQACARAGIPPCSPNDLRRTCATWLRAQGAPPHLIAPVMGHVDSRMIERVYGRLTTDHLAAGLAEELGPNSLPNVCLRPADPMDGMDAMDGDGNEKAAENRGFVVPRDGIEPPTRGFSIAAKSKRLRALGPFFRGLAAPVPRERIAVVLPRTKPVAVKRRRTAWERLDDE